MAITAAPSDVGTHTPRAPATRHSNPS